jgi:hypothetical protein
VAVVATNGLARATVTLEDPMPDPGWLVVVLIPEANPICEVCRPGAGCESLVGAFTTLKVKSILHTSRPPGVPGGWRTTGVAGANGTNATFPVVASTTVTVKVVPAQAVPASPTAVGLSWNTPGSADAAGQSPGPVANGVPHEGTRVMAVRVTGLRLSGGVELLTICSEAGRPVWPTVTAAGKVGVTPKPTPALAGPAVTTRVAATMVRTPTRRVTRRGRHARAPTRSG